MYVRDDPFLRGHAWQFLHGEEVVFAGARFVNRTFRYQLAGKNRSLLLTRNGFAWTFQPSEVTEVHLRMMRDRTIELLQFDLANGELIASGEGKRGEP